MAKINPFNNVKNRSIFDTTGKLSGVSYLDNLKKMSVGSGSQVFRADQSGHWAGASKFANAPFSVDMQGNVVATSLDVGGAYIPTGGALSDIGSLGITSTYIDNGAIETPKLAANAVTAAKIAAGTITANEIAANAVTASKIDVSSLSAISANIGTVTAGSITGVSITSTDGGTNRIVLSTGDYLQFYAGGALRSQIRGVTNSGATGIRMTGDLVLQNNKSVLFEPTSGSSYGGISITSGNQFWVTLGTSDQFFIKNNAQNTNLFTVSNSQVFSEKPFAVNGAVTCKEILLNYGQNEGAIRNLNSLEGYNDLSIYGNGTIRLYPGGNKVWFDKNIDLNEKDLDAGNTLWAYSFSNRSDERLKENIKEIRDSLTKVLNLNPVSFDWKKNKKSSYGLIAQEVHGDFPDLVKKSDDGYLSVDYIALIPFLVQSIQELYELQTGRKITKNIKRIDSKLLERTTKEIELANERKNDVYGSKNIIKEKPNERTKIQPN